MSIDPYSSSKKHIYVKPREKLTTEFNKKRFIIGLKDVENPLKIKRITDADEEIKRLEAELAKLDQKILEIRKKRQYESDERVKKLLEEYEEIKHNLTLQLLDDRRELQEGMYDLEFDERANTKTI